MERNYYLFLLLMAAIVSSLNAVSCHYYTCFSHGAKCPVIPKRSVQVHKKREIRLKTAKDNERRA